MENNWQIQEIIGQLGGRGLRGGLVYVGAHNLQARANGICESKVTETSIDFGVGLIFTPNIRRRGARILITVEPSDTYTVRLLFVGKTIEVYKEFDNVYCDQLQFIVEQMYDEYIKTVQGGFISI